MKNSVKLSLVSLGAFAVSMVPSTAFADSTGDNSLSRATLLVDTVGLGVVDTQEGEDGEAPTPNPDDVTPTPNPEAPSPEPTEPTPSPAPTDPAPSPEPTDPAPTPSPTDSNPSPEPTDSAPTPGAEGSADKTSKKKDNVPTAKPHAALANTGSEVGGMGAIAGMFALTGAAGIVYRRRITATLQAPRRRGKHAY